MEKVVVGKLAAGFGKVCQTSPVGLPHVFGIPVAAGGGWARTFNRIWCGSHMNAKSYQGNNPSQQLATATLLAQSTTQESRTICRILESGKSVEPVSRNSVPTDGAQATSQQPGLVMELGRSSSSTSVPEQAFSLSPLQNLSLAQLVQADLQSREMRLEQGLFDMSTGNEELRNSLHIAQKKNSDAKELNLRLTKEAQRARREEVSATQQVKWLEEEVQRLRQKCHSLSKDLRTARRKSTQQRTLPPGDVTSWVSVNTEALEQQPETRASSQYAEHLCESDDASLVASSQGPNVPHASDCIEDSHVEVDEGFCEHSMSSCGESVEILLGDNSAEDCRCDSTLGRHDGETSWGCSSHQVYSLPLLLAHRTMSKSIARGAPGLESTVIPDALPFFAPIMRAVL